MQDYGIGETVSVRMVVKEIIINGKGKKYVLVPWQEDGTDFFNSTTVREEAICEYNG